MSTTETAAATGIKPISVLAAKLRASRPGQGHLATGEEQALRLSMARAGRRCLDWDVMVTGTERSPLEGPADLAAFLKPMALVAGLVSPEGDQGVVALDAKAIAAITGVRTTGHLPRDPDAIEDRPATAIQAALARPLVTFFLMGWHAALTITSERSGNHKTADLVADYRFGNSATSSRTLLLGMPPGEMISMSMILEFGGAVTGRILLAFPVTRIQEPSAPKSDPERNAREAAVWQDHFKGAVMESSAQIEAILHRTHLPWDTINDWKVGSLLPLPVQCLDQVTLQPRGMGRPLVGRLGQLQGARAVRLKYPDKTGTQAILAAEFANNGTAAEQSRPAANAVQNTNPSIEVARSDV
jgi:flagellar motor switch protein FliM